MEGPLRRCVCVVGGVCVVCVCVCLCGGGVYVSVWRGCICVCVEGGVCVLCLCVVTTFGGFASTILAGKAIIITESVDSVCRDTTYTQYMPIQKNLSKTQKRVHL